MWKITISQQSFCWFQVSNDVYVYFIYIVSPYLDYFSKWRAFWSDVYWYYLHFVYRKPSTSHFVLVVIFSITLLLVATAKYSVNTWSCDGTNFKPQDRRQQWDSRFYSRPRPGTWKVRRPEAKGNWGGSGWIPWIRMSPSQATAGPMGHWKSVGPQFSALVQSTVSLVLGNKKIGFQGIPYFPPAHEPGGQDQVGWDIRGWGEKSLMMRVPENPYFPTWKRRKVGLLFGFGIRSKWTVSPTWICLFKYYGWNRRKTKIGNLCKHQDQDMHLYQAELYTFKYLYNIHVDIGMICLHMCKNACKCTK